MSNLVATPTSAKTRHEKLFPSTASGGNSVEKGGCVMHFDPLNFELLSVVQQQELTPTRCGADDGDDEGHLTCGEGLTSVTPGTCRSLTGAFTEAATPFGSPEKSVRSVKKSSTKRSPSSSSHAASQHVMDEMTFFSAPEAENIDDDDEGHQQDFVLVVYNFRNTAARARSLYKKQQAEQEQETRLQPAMAETTSAEAADPTSAKLLRASRRRQEYLQRRDETNALMRKRQQAVQEKNKKAEAAAARTRRKRMVDVVHGSQHHAADDDDEELNHDEDDDDALQKKLLRAEARRLEVLAKRRENATKNAARREQRLELARQRRAAALEEHAMETLPLLNQLIAAGLPLRHAPEEGGGDIHRPPHSPRSSCGSKDNAPSPAASATPSPSKTYLPRVASVELPTPTTPVQHTTPHPHRHEAPDGMCHSSETMPDSPTGNAPVQFPKLAVIYSLPYITSDEVSTILATDKVAPCAACGCTEPARVGSCPSSPHQQPPSTAGSGVKHQRSLVLLAEKLLTGHYSIMQKIMSVAPRSLCTPLHTQKNQHKPHHHTHSAFSQSAAVRSQEARFFMLAFHAYAEHDVMCRKVALQESVHPHVTRARETHDTLRELQDSIASTFEDSSEQTVEGDITPSFCPEMHDDAVRALAFQVVHALSGVHHAALKYIRHVAPGAEAAELQKDNVLGTVTTYIVEELASSDEEEEEEAFDDSCSVPPVHTADGKKKQKTKEAIHRQEQAAQLSSDLKDALLHFHAVWDCYVAALTKDIYIQPATSTAASSGGGGSRAPSMTAVDREEQRKRLNAQQSEESLKRMMDTYIRLHRAQQARSAESDDGNSTSTTTTATSAAQFCSLSATDGGSTSQHRQFHLGCTNTDGENVATPSATTSGSSKSPAALKIEAKLRAAAERRANAKNNQKAKRRAELTQAIERQMKALRQSIAALGGAAALAELDKKAKSL